MGTLTDREKEESGFRRSGSVWKIVSAGSTCDIGSWRRNDIADASVAIVKMFNSFICVSRGRVVGGGPVERCGSSKNSSGEAIRTMLSKYVMCAVM